MDLLGLPDPSLTMRFIVKNMQGVSFQNPNWELIPEDRGVIAKGSTSLSTFANGLPNIYIW